MKIKSYLIIGLLVLSALLLNACASEAEAAVPADTVAATELVAPQTNIEEIQPIENEIVAATQPTETASTSSPLILRSLEEGSLIYPWYL